MCPLAHFQIRSVATGNELTLSNGIRRVKTKPTHGRKETDSAEAKRDEPNFYASKELETNGGSEGSFSSLF